MSNSQDLEAGLESIYTGTEHRALSQVKVNGVICPSIVKHGNRFNYESLSIT
jgi:hypothetical protein